MAGCINSGGACVIYLCDIVKMAGGGGICAGIGSNAVDNDIAEIIQCRNSKPVSFHQHMDKIGNADRYYFYDFFKMACIMERIVLASQSPRRKQLLEWAEVPFDIVIKETDELYPADLPVEEIPVYIARNKALAVKQELSHDRIILAADTVVVLHDQIIGKPKDRNNAIEILHALSGQKHRVITGVVIHTAEEEISFADITEVSFHTLTTDQIIFYVDKYKPYDKAGAYAIQEWIGVIGIKSVRGDFYNVMGLPVSRVVQALEAVSL